MRRKTKKISATGEKEMSEHQDNSKNQEPKDSSPELGENIHCLHLEMLKGYCHYSEA